MNLAWLKRYDHWFVLLVYLVVLGLSISKHELWGDEIHSWNIAKNSSSLSDLLQNIRYEGHPPLWYILLFVLSRFTHNPASMQYLNFLICGALAFVLLFKSQLKLSHKFLILFGYYFIYEYGTLSRNYAIGILFAFLVCLFITKTSKRSKMLYYIFLFLLANTHFLGLILACSFHCYSMWDRFQHKRGKRKTLMHGGYGFVVILPALYFILPPENSAFDTNFWMSLWGKDQFFIALYAPFKSLCPIPAWWEYHFWNTQFVLETQYTFRFLRFVSPFLSFSLIAAVLFIFSKNKGVLLFFTCNLVFTLLFALVFPLSTARYVGFIFIGFVAALWLAKETLDLTKSKRFILNGLFLLQVFAALIALAKDWQYPFSYSEELKPTGDLVPKDKDVITDYWCLNYISAMQDKPFYCIGYDTEKSFLLWDKDMTKMLQRKDLYTEGLRLYFKKNGGKEFYLVSNNSMADLDKRDHMLFKTFNLKLVKSYEDAIEKYSNVYLYKVSLVLLE
jgi:hypothetical protein